MRAGLIKAQDPSARVSRDSHSSRTYANWSFFSKDDWSHEAAPKAEYEKEGKETSVIKVEVCVYEIKSFLELIQLQSRPPRKALIQLGDSVESSLCQLITTLHDVVTMTVGCGQKGAPSTLCDHIHNTCIYVCIYTYVYPLSTNRKRARKHNGERPEGNERKDKKESRVGP